ncbi:unnamed protein product [Acanthosepion pharaonis]|uniref:Uncharacterized protein n=1 Tax=Acanthosepion pharaonis TaxID=158019 RepID=A0A812CCI2_ACAPH|nr:unnamed protein product [Sepia pharaonis]
MDELLNRKSIAVQIVKDKEVETEDEIKQRQTLRKEIANIKYPLIIGNLDKLNSQMCQMERNMWSPCPLVYDENNIENQLNGRITGAICHTQKINDTSSSIYSWLAKSAEPNSLKRNDGPKFIETYQCPSFDENDQTPLPHNVCPKGMLAKALKAQYSPCRVPFRPTFDKLLYSSTCQDILTDIFWHLFLSHFHSIPKVQMNLFHRVAKNYVTLIQLARDTYFTDSFFRELPFLMPQAIYAAFLHCFTDSSHHFDSTFKETIINLVWLWMTGITPSPGIWKMWNCKLLEADNMIMSESKFERKKSRTWNFQETKNDQNLRRDSRNKKPSATKDDIQSSLMLDNEIPSDNFQSHFTRNEDFVRAKTNTKEPNQLSTFEKSKKPNTKLVKTVFNINESCPLVQHFLRIQNAELHAGSVNRIRRTQIESSQPKTD